MLEGIVIFLLFLGPLVFFHELGHFLFARLAGVRVETFSIGFGPKLLKFKRGDTVYAFSLIPLGGYVKMFGDNPLSEEEMTPEEEKVAYTKKGRWARFWIVFGGPLANFILAFFIYFALVSVGEKVPETRFGVLPEKTILYDLGFRTGDVVKKINSQEIVSFDDLNLVDSEVKEVSIKRGDSIKTISVNMTGMDFIKNFSKFNSLFRAPVLVNTKGEFYLIKEKGLSDLTKILSLEEYNASSKKEFELFKIDSKVPDNRINYEELGLGKDAINLSVGEGTNLFEELKTNNFYPSDLAIGSVLMGSAAEEVKLKQFDIITALDGKEIARFEELRQFVQKMKEGEKVKLTVLNAEGKKELDVAPQLKEYNGTKMMSIGIASSIRLHPVRMIEVESKGLFDSIAKAWDRTYEGSVKTVLGFKKLITGEVSLKQVGGPIAIGQVATDSFHISLSMFFRLMALISINLGIINLLPIPVLDGGHIVFILLETLNRGPLSKKKIEYAQQVGLSILFILIFGALFNDISRLF